MPSLLSVLRPRRLALAAGVLGAISFGLAYQFALKYRERAGLPHRSPVEGSPADFGLAFESVEVPSGDGSLAAWFVPAEDSGGRRGSVGPRPAVAIVHGWESNRGRSMAHIRYLHAAGFHCLVVDVRGHGDNPPEELPVNVPEFGEAAAAAARWLAGRPEVSAVGLLGHSMGGAGAILAGASEPVVQVVVALSSPADLVRMTRKTFEIAEMNIPAPIAAPLAYLTAAVLLVPRRHSIDDASACVAAARYRGPLLLMHGEDDRGVPVAHLGLIADAARGTRTDPGSAPIETLIVPGCGHRWLYEDAEVRRRTASFFAAALGGPVAPEKAGELAAACVVERPENPVYGFGAASAAQKAEAEARDKARREARTKSDRPPLN
ncbi:MAG: alpha/beta fold hydrolase [Candidatus Limnocylindrales bacterium]|jgi:pimeloyl-ACP methyl ester carboxylesterase